MGSDRHAYAVRMDAADGDLVDQGYKRVAFSAVHEERLAWAMEGGRKVPQQGAPGESRSYYYQPGAGGRLRLILHLSHLFCPPDARMRVYPSKRAFCALQNG